MKHERRVSNDDQIEAMFDRRRPLKEDNVSTRYKLCVVLVCAVGAMGAITAVSLIGASIICTQIPECLIGGM